MDKKSFEMVLDEVRKAVMTDYKVKALEHVHGYFSCEQVIELLRYFSWAEPQLKAVKAMQQKMVAIPAAKVVNILNCFTFTKDRLSALELLAINISDASNYRPIEDIFKTSANEKKRCRRVLEQAAKAGCKAPNPMISSCGMIPGNPYPKGRPSRTNGIFPGTPIKKEGEETNEGKGIAARILGPCKPAPSTYNPHRPVPYPIPPCRTHPTLAPSAYINGTHVSVLNATANGTAPPPPYSPNAATGGEENAAQAKTTPTPVPTPSSTPHISPPRTNSSAPPTPSATPSATPVPPPAPSPAKVLNPPSTPTPSLSGMNLPASSPVFTGQATPSMTSPKPSTPSPSVMKSSPMPPSTPTSAANPPSMPSPALFPSLPHSAVPTQPSSSSPYASTGTSDPLPALSLPGLAFSNTTSTVSVSTANMVPSLFPGLPLSLNPAFQGMASPTLSDIAGAAGQMNIGNPLLSVLKGFLANDPSLLNSPSMSAVPPAGLLPLQSLQNAESASTINKSFTPPSTPTPQRTATPAMSVFSGSPSPLSNPITTSTPGQGPLASPSPLSSNLGIPQGHNPPSSMPEHSLSSSPSSRMTPVPKAEPASPSPSAFKGPSRSATPSHSALGLSGMLGHVFPPGAGSLSNSINPNLSGLSSIGSSMGSPTLSSIGLGSSPGMPAVFPPFPTLSSGSPFVGSPALTSSVPVLTSATTGASATPPLSSSVFPGLTAAAAASAFPLGLSTAVPSLFPVPQASLVASNPSFPGFPMSNTPPVTPGLPALPSFPGLPASSALPASPAVPSAPSPASVLPGFASAFSSNFNSALVAQPGPSAFPLLSLSGLPGFHQTPPQSLQGLQQSAAAAVAAQTAILQAHSASALEGFSAQADAFAGFAAGAGSPFPLQPGLPQRGWQ